MSIPIYMQVVHKDIPASVKFPRDELCEQLESKYWTNCPAWMIGMAIAMGFEEIGVVGVDMAMDTEYATQRPCCEHWLGFARGKGIKTWVPELSDLMKSVGLYGYKDEGSMLSRKLEDRLEWLHGQDNERLRMIRELERLYEDQNDEFTKKLNMFEGALLELSTHRGSARRTDRINGLKEAQGKAHAALAALRAEYQEKHTKLAAERNQLVGGIQNTNYMLRSWMVRTDNPNVSGIPSAETRAADPRTGIQAPSGDTKKTEALVGV